MGQFIKMVYSGYRVCLILILSCLSVTRGIEIPADFRTGLPTPPLYQPEKAAEVPIRVGERRCDNFYHGSILPCLIRPWLPPYSYSTTEGNNGEY